MFLYCYYVCLQSTKRTLLAYPLNVLHVICLCYLVDLSKVSISKLFRKLLKFPEMLDILASFYPASPTATASLVSSFQFLSFLCTQGVWHIQEDKGSGLWGKPWNKFSMRKGLSVVNDINFIHRWRKLRLIKSLFVFNNAFDVEAEEYTFNAKSLKSLTVFEKECACMHVCLGICMLCGCISLSLPFPLCPTPSLTLPPNSPSYFSPLRHEKTLHAHYSAPHIRFLWLRKRRDKSLSLSPPHLL